MSTPFTKEIAELQTAGIIDDDTASRIHQYYSRQNDTSSGNFTSVLRLLGALLASAGIILLIAHNWDELGKSIKTTIAFVPLVIGQALCAYTFLKRKASGYWREVSAIILFAGIGTCMAIISQIYHINGDLSSFLLTWMLLGLPLVYLMPSNVVALFYVAGISWYACNLGEFLYFGSHQTPVLYWGLLALLIPHYLKYYNKSTHQTYFTFLNWFLCLSLIFCLGSFSTGSTYSVSWLSYISLFSLFILLGKLDGLDQPGFFRNPLKIIGLTGVYVILYLWSFEGAWNGYYSRQHDPMRFSFMMAFSALCIVGCVALYLYLNKKKIVVSPIWMSCIVYAAAAVLLRENYRFGLLVVNGWILLNGVLSIRRGSLENNMSILNFGLLTILLLAIFRFFDDSIPFVWRGLFFLTAGAGFFVANFMMIKKRAALKAKA